MLRALLPLFDNALLHNSRPRSGSLLDSYPVAIRALAVGPDDVPPCSTILEQRHQYPYRVSRAKVLDKFGTNDMSVKAPHSLLLLCCKIAEHAHAYVGAEADPLESCRLLAGVSQISRNPNRDSGHVAAYEKLLLLGVARTVLDKVRVLHRSISI